MITFTKRADEEARDSDYVKPERFESAMSWYLFFRAIAKKRGDGPITAPVIVFPKVKR